MVKRQLRQNPLPSNLRLLWEFLRKGKRRHWGQAEAQHNKYWGRPRHSTTNTDAGWGTAQQILSLGPTMTWVVNATPHPLYILSATWGQFCNGNVDKSYGFQGWVKHFRGMYNLQPKVVRNGKQEDGNGLHTLISFITFYIVWHSITKNSAVHRLLNNDKHKWQSFKSRIPQNPIKSADYSCPNDMWR